MAAASARAHGAELDHTLSEPHARRSREYNRRRCRERVRALLAAAATRMPAGDASEITRHLAALDGDAGRAAQALFPHVYGELRAIAGRAIRQGGPGPTLQPTLLVHEAYLKILRGEHAVSIHSR